MKIQLRRGTAAEWTTANPTLASGEPGVETDTGKWKLGDGTTAWTALGYQAGSEAVLSATYAPTSASRDRAFRTWDSQLADPSVSPRLFIYGHSVVAGSGATDQPHCFAKLLRYRITSMRANATVSIEGIGGYSSAQLLANLPGTFAAQPAGSVGCVVLMGLLNDYQSQVNPATSQANIASIIATMRAHASAAAAMTFVVVTEWTRSDVVNPTYPMSEYVAAAKAAVAGDPNATVIDMGTRTGDVAGNTLGLFSDSAHPNNKGHALVAAALGSELTRARIAAPPLPASTAILAPSPPVAHVGWAGRTRDSDNQMLRYSDAVQNNSITYQFVGDAGMYSVALDYRAQANGGKFDLYIDGVLQGAGAQWEGYAAVNATTFNQIDGFYVGTSGLHSVKLVMATKHASSSGYAGVIRGIYLTRTGDLTS